MANMTVVRNRPQSRGSVGAVERHNERKNENYTNIDVVLEQSENNVYFKRCENTYLQTFDNMVKDNIIAVRGLKDDANIMGEMIFDVNTRYFEDNGGYEFAKDFYEKAYKFAVDLVGDERYILSAVMHADERNKAVSDELGKEVYHYHLHVVYVPVVEKEIFFSKRSKDKAGQLKEVINQVSHSKKWRSDLESGVKSYTKLQDDFSEYMKSAGYDVERGEKGSTKENLSVLEYKTQQETNRLQDIILQAMAEKEVLEEYEKKVKTKKEVIKLGKELKDIGKPAILTNEIKLTQEEFKDLKKLAKNGITMQDEVRDLKKELKEVKNKYNSLVDVYNTLKATYERLLEDFSKLTVRTEKFIEALKYAPERVKEFISGILGDKKQEQERQRQERQQQRKKSKSYDIGGR